MKVFAAVLCLSVVSCSYVQPQEKKVDLHHEVYAPPPPPPRPTEKCGPAAYFSECRKLRDARTRLQQEVDCLKKRQNSLLAEVEHEKQVSCDLSKECSEIRAMVDQQTDFYTSLGSTTYTLLWGASQEEGCIQHFLNGTTSDHFLKLSSHILQSFLNTNLEGRVSVDRRNQQFVDALMGVINNITATPLGREVFSTRPQGVEVIKCVVGILELCDNKFVKLKNIILKTLYNLSINKSGLGVVSNDERLISGLVRVIQEEKYPENKLHALRLIQSINAEPSCHSPVERILALLSLESLRKLSKLAKGEVLIAFEEVIKDLQNLPREL